MRGKMTRRVCAVDENEVDGVYGIGCWKVRLVREKEKTISIQKVG